MGANRFFSVLVLLVVSSLARSQQFATIDIKPSSSSAPGPSRLQVLPSGDLIGHSVPIIELIGLAYAVPSNPSPRLASLPEWTVRRRFDIEAETPTSLKLDTKDIQVQRRTIEPLATKAPERPFRPRGQG
jgi:hypothetical protein